jgi:hypothetical protein
MTTPDIAGLCERDMEYLREALAFQANIADAGGLITTARVCREAADTLERQAAEIKRLRALVKEKHGEHQFRYGDEEIPWMIAARAALTGEDS